MNKNNKKPSDNFSIALGLFDYINPICYSITTITILLNLKSSMSKFSFILYLIGASISLIFGLSIPTVKSLVGLGKMKFKMPVNLVFYVNSGILISGLALFNYLFQDNKMIVGFTVLLICALIILMLFKTKKFNTTAVLIGSFGYLLKYNSLIKLAIVNSKIVCIILYIIAICLFIFLCGIGIKANLKDARIHWLIEISNVICQFLVMLSTIILFNVV